MLRKKWAGCRCAPARIASRDRRSYKPTCACSLGQTEYPDHAAFGDFLLPSRQIVDQALLERRIDTPARYDRDVLLAVDCERRRRCGDAGIGAHLPQHLAVLRIECAELAIVGAAGEHKAAAGREHRS